MKRNITFLVVLLVLQAALALALHQSGGLSSPAGGTPLLTLEADKIARIAIEEPGGAKVELRKTEGKWVLADGGVPVDQGKVKQLIDQLKAIHLATPIATSPGAFERFKVAGNNFERRIEAGGETAPAETLYFGNAQRGNQTSARRAEQKAVYAVKFSIQDALIDSEAWKEKVSPGAP